MKKLLILIPLAFMLFGCKADVEEIESTETYDIECVQNIVEKAIQSTILLDSNNVYADVEGNRFVVFEGVSISLEAYTQVLINTACLVEVPEGEEV